jgi:sec-independent protein translocase protein TatB
VFDIGFFELLLIGVVALLVIGPERLPTVARKAGMWVGRARRFVGQVKRDIDQEIQNDEYRRLLDDKNLKNPVHEIVEDTRKQFSDIKQETESAVSAAGDSDKKTAGDSAEK